MAIQQNFTVGAAETAASAATNSSSVFGVCGEFTGTVSLLATFPGAPRPVVILQTTNNDVMEGVLTPDPAIQYAIRGALISGSAAAYFGA